MAFTINSYCRIRKIFVSLLVSTLVFMKFVWHKANNDFWINMYVDETPLTFTGSNEINCHMLVMGNTSAVKSAYVHMQKYSYKLQPDGYFTYFARNCTSFKEYMFYQKIPVSEEERNYPLAFIIMMYNNVEQMLRLLRAIYRSHNIYCIHVDLSAKRTIHKAIDAISSCYDNVFVVSKKEDIVYGHFSRLHAEINCMSDLLRVSNKWKYVLNVPSQQFPLKTNKEIVEILKAYNGSNVISGIKNESRLFKSRYENRYTVINNEMISIGKKEPFHLRNISIVKGQAIGAFSKAFIQYALNSSLAKDLLAWMRDVYSPDEYYWATLNHNQAIPAPGRYLGHPDERPHLAVYVSWEGHNPCRGKHIRTVCIFGIEDLQELVKSPCMFANKFHLDYQPLTLDCLEEWYFAKALNRRRIRASI